MALFTALAEASDRRKAGETVTKDQANTWAKQYGKANCGDITDAELEEVAHTSLEDLFPGDKPCYERYIVTTWKDAGYWGSGDTLNDAARQCRRAAGVRRLPIERTHAFIFMADVPFKPYEDGAADCYVTASGTMEWTRCSREKLDLTVAITNGLKL
jgi:hypothetical protein